MNTNCWERVSNYIIAFKKHACHTNQQSWIRVCLFICIFIFICITFL